MFKVVTNKDRLLASERQNKELLVRIEELTSALIEVAEIITEEEQDG